MLDKNGIAKRIAQELKDVFLEMYHANHDLKKPYEFTLKDVAKRRLTNRSLFYLSMLDDKTIFENIIIPHFKIAFLHNMTDTMAALHCIVSSSSPERENALNAFYHRWQHDALVISVAVTTSLLLFGVWYFRRMEHSFADVI